MMFTAPVEFVYLLMAVFLILSVLFLTGRGSSLLISRNTVQKEKFQPVKIGKALGVCCLILTLLLGVTAVCWECLPDWYAYLFFSVLTIMILAVTILCNLNIIFK